MSKPTRLAWQRATLAMIFVRSRAAWEVTIGRRDAGSLFQSEYHTEISIALEVLIARLVADTWGRLDDDTWNCTRDRVEPGRFYLALQRMYAP